MGWPFGGSLVMSASLNLPALAAACLAACFAAPAASAQTWTAWSEADVRGLIESENGVVTEVTPVTDGEMSVYATLDGWLHMAFIGEDCRSQGGKAKCESLAFNALFEVDDAARSRQLETELSYQYVADLADGEDFVIHRQVELRGGASLANIREQLTGFIVVAEGVAARVWPDKDGAGAGKAP